MTTKGEQTNFSDRNHTKSQEITGNHPKSGKSLEIMEITRNHGKASEIKEIKKSVCSPLMTSND
jgi:hypothetical protein